MRLRKAYLQIAERYRRAEALLSWNVLRRVYGWNKHPRWLGPNDARFWYRSHTRRGHEFVFVESAAAARRPAFNQARLAAALEHALASDLATLPYRRIDRTKYPFNGE